MRNKKEVIVLTGGIASGKSAVVQVLKSIGEEVVDADLIARDAAEDQWVLEEISQVFGAEMVKGHRLDRDAMGKVVFHDDRAREALNAILHPRIYARLEEEAAEILKTRDRVFLDIPLFFETRDRATFVPSAIWCVGVSHETQVARLMVRDGIDRDYAEAKIASQMPLEEKMRKSDVVIMNEGTLDDLKEEVQCALRNS